MTTKLQNINRMFVLCCPFPSITITELYSLKAAHSRFDLKVAAAASRYSGQDNQDRTTRTNFENKVFPRLLPQPPPPNQVFSMVFGSSYSTLYVWTSHFVISVLKKWVYFVPNADDDVIYQIYLCTLSTFALAIMSSVSHAV